MTAVVTVEGLRKSYGSQTAVDGVSFEVDRGEIFGILGPNGAGKTTTVECLQGLRRPDAGRLQVLGLDPATEATRLRRRIGSQLQQSALPDRIRVWEALDLFASLVPGGPDWRTVMAEWGLEPKRDAAFGSLSGGQQQRLFIALALVNQPEVVFLDEMTTGLDPAARRETWGLVRAVRERGTTVVLVTHFMDEAEHLCDRLAVIDRGRLVALDGAAGLIAEHAPEVTVRFTSPGADPAWLQGLPGVAGVTRDGDRFAVAGTGPILSHIAAALMARGIAPIDLRADRATLEDVFLRITGHRLGEAEQDS
jgi:ABC-2 type transport system ATP-binding protein